MVKKYKKNYSDSLADQIDYIFQRTGGDVQLALEPRIVKGSSDPIHDLEDILEYISDICEDHNLIQTADIALS